MLLLLSTAPWARCAASGAALALVCALVGASTPARAQTAAVHVSFDPECAPERARQTLLSELRLRLGESQPVVESPAPPGAWTLRWGPLPSTPCALALSDTALIAALTLPASADDPQLREAVVRVAWFVTTTTPRAPQPPLEAAAIAQATSQAELLAASLTRQSQLLGMRVEAAASAAPDPAQSPDASTWDALSMRMTRWRDSSPELFNTTLGPGTRWLGLDQPKHLHASVVMQPTTLGERATWIWSVEAGLTFGRQTRLGLGYTTTSGQQPLQSRLLRSLGTGDQTEVLVPTTVSLKLGTLGAEYVFFPEAPVQLGLSATLGVGQLNAIYALSEQAINSRRVALMLDARVTLYYDLTTWLQLGFGFGQRGISVIGAPAGEGLSLPSLGGASGLFALRLILF